MNEDDMKAIKKAEDGSTSYKKFFLSHLERKMQTFEQIKYRFSS